MNGSLADRSAPRHPLSLDIGRPVMAKADVKNLDIDWGHAIGSAIQRAVSIAGWSNKEAAGHIGVDAAEFSKWLTGQRRAQLDRLFACDALRQPLIVALSELAGAGVEIETVIRVRRTA